MMMMMMMMMMVFCYSIFRFFLVASLASLSASSFPLCPAWAFTHATTCDISYDGTSFQYLATVLISVFTLHCGPGLTFWWPILYICPWIHKWEISGFSYFKETIRFSDNSHYCFVYNFRIMRSSAALTGIPICRECGTKRLIQCI